MFQKDPLLEQSTSPHSPQNIIPQQIRKNATVLDVGCNTGFLARILKKKKTITDGIDINDEALQKAKKYCRKVYKRDLYSGKFDIDKKQYDYIVFADVLEHLPRPDWLLLDAHNYLAKNGKIIASLPNIARAEIRLNLMLGKFDYTKGGILSEDHLRFFTRKNATEMFEQCGYIVEETIPTGLGHQLNILPELTAFQFIYICSQA
ncbi:MAG: Methyltransferase type 11 [Candidatus Roizmanbacteria bacterium GW2011_GWA2_37_7]|uniref:Methyltransferase type 11 n=1 Tax=Candidatus Roizmanbacteria bacterium GW2011_GWA2_37_7 TaxID=1618481 RepID=A0A0G0H6C4_9BACT|nr:MAG: Methyltransferase type 11 [Candidatus Roizmanbacteria bacterium GW2011_GWA2_37_7]